MARLSSGTSSSVATGTKGLPRDQAEKKIYRDSNGHPVIPGPNIFSSIIQAGVYHKSGKRQITSKGGSLVPAGLSIIEIETPILIPGTKKQAVFEVDSRTGVNPSTGGRVMIHRARFDAWELSFTMEVDEAIFDEAMIRLLVDDAGRRVGLGDFRPAKRGPFGRFKVVHWTVERVRQAA